MGGKPRRVVVKLVGSDETAEIQVAHLRNNQSPWGRKKSLADIETEVNEMGKKTEPEFEFVEEIEKENDKRVVVVMNLDNGNIISARYDNIMQGANPWGNGKFTEEEIEVLVTQLGEKADPSYKFIRYVDYADKNHIVEIKKIGSQDLTFSKYNELKRHNPFNK